MAEYTVHMLSRFPLFPSAWILCFSKLLLRVSHRARIKIKMKHSYWDPSHGRKSDWYDLPLMHIHWLPLTTFLSSQSSSSSCLTVPPIPEFSSALKLGCLVMALSCCLLFPSLECYVCSSPVPWVISYPLTDLHVYEGLIKWHTPQIWHVFIFWFTCCEQALQPQSTQGCIGWAILHELLVNSLHGLEPVYQALPASLSWCST